jgi:tetratricopeptide (TPR) repeat protein
LQWPVSYRKLACLFFMNFTTQAAQDIAGKIERDPIEIRHWRQLLILCFDQKSVETLQTLQVVCSAIDQIWNKKRQTAKEVHDAAKQKQRSTGSREPLPPLSVTAIALSGKQKETLIKLSREPQSPELLFRFGRHLEQDFELPQSAHAIYSRALALEPDDDALVAKIKEAIKRIDTAAARHGETTEHMPKLDTVIAPESMGVKSPSHHRPSAAALIKRTGRLSVDRSRIEPAKSPASETAWPETQKRLDEKMTALIVLAAQVCETAPRPMRLPRSIAPFQWLEFLEGHISMLLETLTAQDINLNITVNIEEAPRHDVEARGYLVASLMEEIEREMTALKPAKPSGKATVRLPVAGVDDIFNRIEAGALEEAEAQMRYLDRSVPKDQASEVWFHLGLAFQNNHENQRAMTAYGRACELNPNNLQACFNSGMIQHEEGMLHPALKSYERSLEIDPQQAKIWCNLGALQFQLGEFQKSVDSFNKAVALKPDYARAWDNLAGSLCALDQLDEAERCCRRALNFKDGYADPYFKLGSISFQRGRMEEAEEAFRKVLEVNPGYPLAGHYLAMVLARTKRLEEALEICERAATPPGETELPSQAWMEMGFNLYERGEYELAIRAYERALTFTPERAVVWLDAGVAHQQMGKLDQARRHYEQAVELEPDLARAWHNLGLVKQELGDRHGAQEALDEAERLLARGR